MRVLHVNKFLYRRGGAEGYMLDVAGLQAANGHDVAFWGTDANAPTGPLSDTYPRYLSLDPPPASAADKARAVSRMMWNREAEKGIAEAIERFRPDVAHLHNIYHQLSPAILRPLRRSGVPVVLTLHDYKLACPTYQFLDKGAVCEACLGGGFRQAVKRRCRNGSLVSSSLMAAELGLHTRLGSYDAVDVFVCPSRFMARKMTDAGVFPDRMRHLPHPVEPPSEGKAVPGGGVFFAGRLSHEKGVDVLLEAFARVKDPDAVLTIAGEGPELEALQRQAERLVPGRVTFAGRLPKDGVLAGIRAAATVVVPSRWYENQPLAVLEAMACGVPVIGTDLGGIPELIEHGRTGWLVPPDDAVELALAIDDALADPTATLARGAAARDHVAGDFSVRRHLTGLDALYDEARARSGRTEEAACG